MTATITFLFTGLVFGLSGGLSPGPLLTLVISETLKHGASEGLKVAMAPLLTDLPILLMAIFVLSQLADIQPALGAISLLGGAVLAYYGYESLAFKGVNVDVQRLRPQSLKKGVIANLLNPNPYLFWFSIGGPTTLKALNIGVVPAGLFIGGFYLVLVGSKALLAVLIGKSRHLLGSALYIYTIRFLGVALLGFAVFFVVDGLMLVGWIE